MRLIHNGVQAFSSFALGRTGLEVLNRQMKLLKRAKAVPMFKPLAENQSTAKASIESREKRLNEEELMRWGHTIQQVLASELPSTTEVSIRVTSQLQERNFENSAGAKITETSELTFALAQIKTANTATYSLSFRPMFDVQKQLTEQLQHAGFGKETKLHSGDYPVILGPKATWVLIHELVGHQVEADRVIDGTSSYGGLLGEKVASTEVTIIDDPFLMDFGGYQFDDEGTKGQGTLVVEDGILSNYLHSRETALLFDTQSTGNFLSESFEYRPIVRQSNLLLEPSDWSLEELLEHVKNGIFIEDCIQGITFSPDGRFHLRARSGRVIQNGRLEDTLANFSLEGDPQTVLGNVFGIGTRIRPWSAGCIKAGQYRTVGAVAPAIGIDSMRVVM